MEYNELCSVVKECVDKCKIIDLHSHLFPQSFDDLYLIGIDNLLTYHYLVSELFIVWNDLSPSKFYKLSKECQANIIWEELFIKRSPLSEACKGVITTCIKLGLIQEIDNRDLDGIRSYFKSLKLNKQEYEAYTQQIFEMSNIEYTIMTNQIFDLQEIKYLEKYEIPSQFKTSLRIDKLLFDFENCCKFVNKFDYTPDIDGIKNYIRYWHKKIKPEYFMASLPFDFTYYQKDLNAKCFKMDSTNVIDFILVPLSIELNLPIAFKFGTRRHLNPELKDAGDSLGVASVESLANLCSINKKCKFLATFLSKVNQHQLCVVARNFQNLHIYGCWWYLNNPSLIEEITKMRLEMLGLGFTAQHSDARVLEQLLYKWTHSRQIIANVLIKKYDDLIESGWIVGKNEIKRDVHYLFRGSYEEFMKKKLIY